MPPAGQSRPAQSPPAFPSGPTPPQPTVGTFPGGNFAPSGGNFAPAGNVAAAPQIAAANESKTQPEGKAKPNQLSRDALIAIAAAAAIILMLSMAAAALLVYRLSPGEDKTAAGNSATGNPVAGSAAGAGAASAASAPPIEYREVKAPENLRKKIYKDLRMAADSSTGAKVPLGKDSAIRKHLNKTMQKVLDREFKMQALQNNMSEDDVREIFKEGTAKQW
ncbi:MAG: hypothetical protein AAF958_12245 [Planctomycetota bacterium]